MWPDLAHVRDNPPAEKRGAPQRADGERKSNDLSLRALLCGGRLLPRPIAAADISFPATGVPCRRERQGGRDCCGSRGTPSSAGRDKYDLISAWTSQMPEPAAARRSTRSGRLKRRAGNFLDLRREDHYDDDGGERPQGSGFFDAGERSDGIPGGSRSHLGELLGKMKQYQLYALRNVRCCIVRRERNSRALPLLLLLLGAGYLHGSRAVRTPRRVRFSSLTDLDRAGFATFEQMFDDGGRGPRGGAVLPYLKHMSAGGLRTPERVAGFPGGAFVGVRGVGADPDTGFGGCETGGAGACLRPPRGAVLDGRHLVSQHYGGLGGVRAEIRRQDALLIWMSSCGISSRSMRPDSNGRIRAGVRCLQVGLWSR